MTETALTLPQLFRDRAKKRGQKTARKFKRGGSFMSTKRQAG